MHGADRERWKRIASLVLVAVVAAFSLPLGASAVVGGAMDRSADIAPTHRARVQRLHIEARPVATNRRPIVQRDLTLPAGSLLVAALVVVGLLLADHAIRLSWTPCLLPVERGPPSSR